MGIPRAKSPRYFEAHRVTATQDYSAFPSVAGLSQTRISGRHPRYETALWAASPTEPKVRGVSSSPGARRPQRATAALLLRGLGRHVPVNLVAPAVASCSPKSLPGREGSMPPDPSRTQQLPVWQEVAAGPGGSSLGKGTSGVGSGLQTGAPGLRMSSMHRSLLGTR